MTNTNNLTFARVNFYDNTGVILNNKDEVVRAMTEKEILTSMSLELQSKLAEINKLKLENEKLLKVDGYDLILKLKEKIERQSTYIEYLKTIKYESNNRI